MSYRPPLPLPPLPPRPHAKTAPSAPPQSPGTAPTPSHEEPPALPAHHQHPPLPPTPSEAQIESIQFDSPEPIRNSPPSSNQVDDQVKIVSPSIKRRPNGKEPQHFEKTNRYSYIDQNILPRHIPQPGSIEEHLYRFLQDHEDPTLRCLQTVEIVTIRDASTVPGVMNNHTTTDMFTLLAFAIHGDTKLADQVKGHIIFSLRALADWVEAPKKDLSRVVAGMTPEDLDILLRWLVPPTKPVRGGDVLEIDANQVREKHKHEIHRSATTLRKISNQLNQHEHSGGPHPTIIGAIVAALYKRGVVLFENAGLEVHTSKIFPPNISQLPVSYMPLLWGYIFSVCQHNCFDIPNIYLAFTNYDSSVVHLLVPQEELHVPQTPVEMVALVPAYNESEEELMRTWQSFKIGCTEQVQVIFFVDGIHKDGRGINHGTLQAILNHFDVARVGRDQAIGKDDLQVLLADVDTLGDELNATMEYILQDTN